MHSKNDVFSPILAMYNGYHRPGFQEKRLGACDCWLSCRRFAVGQFLLIFSAGLRNVCMHVSIIMLC